VCHKLCCSKICRFFFLSSNFSSSSSAFSLSSCTKDVLPQRRHFASGIQRLGSAALDKIAQRVCQLGLDFVLHLLLTEIGVGAQRGLGDEVPAHSLHAVLERERPLSAIDEEEHFVLSSDERSHFFAGEKQSKIVRAPPPPSPMMDGGVGVHTITKDSQR
jgi:hypothetical protein